VEGWPVTAMKIAYLSLGSNLGDREQKLAEALALLHSPDLRVRRVSPVYETDPLDYLTQPCFLNLVAEIESDLFPLQLLSRTQKVERALGRTRVIPKGPRTIDVDIILYGNFVVKTPRLEIPHPRYTERRFVLEPLAELAPDLRDPPSRRTVRELLAGVAGQRAKKIGFLPSLPVL
jgi:2-amino-4-hydroxy-6-hydroxymethyldihydropteridine diphosphokinase